MGLRLTENYGLQAIAVEAANGTIQYEIDKATILPPDSFIWFGVQAGGIEQREQKVVVQAANTQLEQNVGVQEGNRQCEQQAGLQAANVRQCEKKLSVQAANARRHRCSCGCPRRLANCDSTQRERMMLCFLLGMDSPCDKCMLPDDDIINIVLRHVEHFWFRVVDHKVPPQWANRTVAELMKVPNVRIHAFKDKEVADGEMQCFPNPEVAMSGAIFTSLECSDALQEVIATLPPACEAQPPRSCDCRASFRQFGCAGCVGALCMRPFACLQGVRAWCIPAGCACWVPLGKGGQ